MNRYLIVSAALLSSLASLAASAKPGEYWEVTIKTEVAGMPFQMPAMTQRECFQNGDVDNPEKASGDKSCKMSNVKKVGNKITWDMRCDRNGEMTTGSGEQTTSANSYNGKMQMVSRANGQDSKMSMSYSGKRIGGSCEAQ